MGDHSRSQTPQQGRRATTGILKHTCAQVGMEKLAEEMRKRKAPRDAMKRRVKRQRDAMPATSNETAPVTLQWREIKPDAFRFDYIEPDDRTWYAGDGTTHPAEIGYCLRVRQLNHTTKCYYIPHDPTIGEWPGGYEQHVESFFNTHPEAERSEASYGFLV